MARKVTVSIVCAAAGLNFDSDVLSQNWGVYQGVVVAAEIRVPNFANAITADFKLRSISDVTMWQELALAKNTNHFKYPLDKPPLVIGEDIRITLSGAAGGTGGTVEVDLFYLPTV